MTRTSEKTIAPGGTAPHSTSRPARRPRGVLVVDDNEEVRDFLGVGLRASGFAAWLAAGGSEAVDVYREHGSAIDLLLLDVQMPGCDGPEVLAAIRALSANIACCFMSGDTGHYTERELLDLGAVGVLQKPFLISEVVAQLRRMGVPMRQREELQEKQRRESYWD